MRRALAHILLVALGLAIFGVSGEVFCRYWFRSTPQYDVEMWRYARELKVWGRTPGLRFEHRPNALARLMGVEVRTNAAGMRDVERVAGTPAEGRRVAVLGDSITLGWGVPVDEAYPARLERALNRGQAGRRFEVLNFGVGNYNTLDELAMLQERALAYGPDIVLLAVYLNDAEESRPRRSSFVLQHSAFAVWLWSRVDALLRRAGAREGYVEYYRNLYGADEPGFGAMRRALSSILSICRERGIAVVVAMFPELHDLSAYPFEKVQRWVGQQARSGGALFVDLRDALPAGDSAAWWVAPDDSHPNSEAHARYAEFLAAAVPWAEIGARNP